MNGNGMPMMTPPMGQRGPMDGSPTTPLAPQAAPPYAPVAPVAPVQNAQGPAPWMGPPTPAAAPVPQKVPITQRLDATHLNVLHQGLQHLAATGSSPDGVLHYFPDIDLDDMREVARGLGLESGIRWDLATTAPPAQVPPVSAPPPAESGQASGKKLSKKRDYPLITAGMAAGKPAETIAAELGLKPESVAKAVVDIQQQQQQQQQQPPQPQQPGQLGALTQAIAPPAPPAPPAASVVSGAEAHVHRAAAALAEVNRLRVETGLSFLEIAAAAELLGTAYA